MQEADIILDTD